jgi:hypothetical protein
MEFPFERPIIPLFYFGLAGLFPLLMVFRVFFSLDGFSLVWGFTLVSLVAYLSADVGFVILSYFLLPWFYVLLAFGLLGENKIVWSLALASNVLTFLADLGNIPNLPNFFGLNYYLPYYYGAIAGVAFHIIITIYMSLYFWNHIVEK